MNYKLPNRDILYNDQQLGPYPDHLLKRVDKLTVDVPGPVQSFKHGDAASARVLRGEFGEQAQKGQQRLVTKIPIGAAYLDIRTNHININTSVQNPVAETKAPLPNDPRVIARHLKSLGYFMGADQMAICQVPEGCLFTDYPDGRPINSELEDCKYALIFVKRKHFPTTIASDGRDWIFDSCSHQVYQPLAGMTDTVADYIRRLGYNAIASNQNNYVNLMTPLLLHSGVGESSRLGIALSPFFGANFKSACVLTDLPMECDKPIDFGLQEFCRNCTICADSCPCKAISYTKEYVPYHGYMSWGMNFERCSAGGAMNQDGSVCGNCTRTCPWNRPDSMPEDFKDWDGSIEWLHERANVRAKYIRDHDLHDESELTQKWWFDFEDVHGDGKLTIPKNTRYEIIED